MPKHKTIPIWVVWIAMGSIGWIYLSKFSPIFKKYFPKEPVEKPVFDSSKFFAAETPSPTPIYVPTPRPPTPTAVPTIFPATPTPPIAARAEAVATPEPDLPLTPSNALKFIDRYIALGEDPDPLARQSLILFPYNNGSEQVAEEDWINARQHFGQNVSAATYRRIGKGMMNSNQSQGSAFIMTVPIEYTQVRSDGQRFAGIAVDMIGVTRVRGGFKVFYHAHLCDRTTLENGRGIMPSSWRLGHVSRRMPANIRAKDDDSDANSILKEVPAGSRINYLPEKDRWLIVKDEEGIVGFMAAALVEK